MRDLLHTQVRRSLNGEVKSALCVSVGLVALILVFGALTLPLMRSTVWPAATPVARETIVRIGEPEPVIVTADAVPAPAEARDLPAAAPAPDATPRPPERAPSALPAAAPASPAPRPEPAEPVAEDAPAAEPVGESTEDAAPSAPSPAAPPLEGPEGPVAQSTRGDADTFMPEGPTAATGAVLARATPTPESAQPRELPDPGVGVLPLEGREHGRDAGLGAPPK